MKKMIFLFVLSITGGAVFAQDIAEKDVPAVVLNAFQQKFTKVDDAEWEKENNQFSVEFEFGKSDHKAWLDATGKIVMYGQEIEVKDLPETVKAAIKRDYNGYDIEDVYKIGENNTVLYAAELEKGKEELNVVFNADGKGQ